jgi:hypothetical protein
MTEARPDGALEELRLMAVLRALGEDAVSCAVVGAEVSATGGGGSDLPRPRQASFEREGGVGGFRFCFRSLTTMLAASAAPPAAATRKKIIGRPG